MAVQAQRFNTFLTHTLLFLCKAKLWQVFLLIYMHMKCSLQCRGQFWTAPHVENTNTHPFYKIPGVMASMNPSMSHLQMLKAFLELFHADVVQNPQHFLFHFSDICKMFPFHLPFHTREQKKVVWRKVWWIERMTDNCHVVFAKNCCTLKAVRAGALSWWRNQSPLVHISGRWHELQDKPVISEISSVVRWWFELIVLRTFSRFSSFWQVEGRPDLGWSSHHISPPLKREYCSYAESYLQHLAAFKQFQQLISLTENKTSHTLYVLYYQPS